MEEIRLAAKAYYKHSSKELQDSASQFFKSMDSNGDKKISSREFSEFLQRNGYEWVSSNMFAQLDANNDGSLDFWEFLAFYYTLKTRSLWCKACSAHLTGLYFTCVTCFDKPGAQHSSFDLCAKCYGKCRFRHRHSVFLDNFVLLRSKRGDVLSQTKPPNANPANANPDVVARRRNANPANDNEAVVARRRNANPANDNEANRWFRAMNVGIKAGNLLIVGANLIGLGCSVM